MNKTYLSDNDRLSITIDQEAEFKHVFFELRPDGKQPNLSWSYFDDKVTTSSGSLDEQAIYFMKIALKLASDLKFYIEEVDELPDSYIFFLIDENLGSFKAVK